MRFLSERCFYSVSPCVVVVFFFFQTCMSFSETIFNDLMLQETYFRQGRARCSDMYLRLLDQNIKKKRKGDAGVA